MCTPSQKRVYQNSRIRLTIASMFVLNCIQLHVTHPVVHFLKRSSITVYVFVLRNYNKSET